MHVVSPSGDAATPAVPLHCAEVDELSVPLDGEAARTAPAHASSPATHPAAASRLSIHAPPGITRTGRRRPPAQEFRPQPSGRGCMGYAARYSCQMSADTLTPAAPAARSRNRAELPERFK